MICTSYRSVLHPFEGFNLPRIDHGCGYPPSDSGERTSHLAPCGVGVLVGFPVTPVFITLVSPLIRTRWPVIQNG